MPRDVQGEIAFAALVAWHGPMVLGTCRHLLGDSNDADDAFQGTFLTLARKVGSIRQPDRLAAWLPEKYRTPVVLCYLEGHTHERDRRHGPGMARGDGRSHTNSRSDRLARSRYRGSDPERRT